MKKLFIMGASLAALSLGACSQVRPGYVGVMIHQYGSDAGVDPKPLGTGRYFTWMGTSIDEYPVFTKNYTYSASNDEGRQVDESITFQDKNGLNIGANVGVNVSVDPALAPKLYTKYRVELDGIIANALRNEVRNELIEQGSRMGIEEIYGPRKQELMDAVQNKVQTFFLPYGLRVEKLFWAGPLKLPDAVSAQITNKIANEQAAMAEQQKVATIQAQAQQQIAAAEGKAKAIQVEADALRSNPQVLQLRAIEKWTGTMPMYMGSGQMPFLTMPVK